MLQEVAQTPSQKPGVFANALRAESRTSMNSDANQRHQDQAWHIAALARVFTAPLSSTHIFHGFLFGGPQEWLRLVSGAFFLKPQTMGSNSHIHVLHPSGMRRVRWSVLLWVAPAVGPRHVPTRLIRLISTRGPPIQSWQLTRGLRLCSFRRSPVHFHWKEGQTWLGAQEASLRTVFKRVCAPCAMFLWQNSDPSLDLWIPRACCIQVWRLRFPKSSLNFHQRNNQQPKKQPATSNHQPPNHKPPTTNPENITNQRKSLLCDLRKVECCTGRKV